MLRRIMIRHILSIVWTTLFLVGSTYCWFNFRNKDIYEEYHKENLVVSEPIVFNSLKKVKDEDIDKLDGYNFQLSNTGSPDMDIKIILVSDMLEESVSNNYIKYQINNSTIHSLNMDGVIYIDNLKNLETKDINLKVWISDTYTGNLNYNGRVVVS